MKDPVIISRFLGRVWSHILHPKGCESKGGTLCFPDFNKAIAAGTCCLYLVICLTNFEVGFNRKGCCEYITYCLALFYISSERI